MTLTIATGCAEPPPPAPPPAPVAAQPTPQPFGEMKWGEFRSKRFELLLPLPDGRSWKIDDHSGPWLTATHPASGSTLLARTWIEDGGKVDRHRCEEKARLWKKLPDHTRAEMIEEKTIASPPGFDTFVEVGVVPDKKGGAIEAFAVAFGGYRHRCFAYVLTTGARGEGAEKVVGERLATMVDKSLGAAVLESDLAPKLERAPGQ